MKRTDNVELSCFAESHIDFVPESSLFKYMGCLQVWPASESRPHNATVRGLHEPKSLHAHGGPIHRGWGYV